MVRAHLGVALEASVQRFDHLGALEIGVVVGSLLARRRCDRLGGVDRRIELRRKPTTLTPQDRTVLLRGNIGQQVVAAVAHLLLGQLGRLFGYLARDHAPSATHPYRFRRAQVKGTPDNGWLSGGRPHFLPQP